MSTIFKQEQQPVFDAGVHREGHVVPIDDHFRRNKACEDVARRSGHLLPVLVIMCESRETCGCNSHSPAHENDVHDNRKVSADEEANAVLEGLVGSSNRQHHLSKRVASVILVSR